MPITIVDDDVNGRPAFTITDDDTRRAIMAIKAISEGGTGTNMSATGPGLIKQASTGANFSVQSIAIGELVYGTTGGAPAALAANNTSTRKFLSERAAVTDTPVPAWDVIAASDITSGQLAQARGGTGLDTTATGPGIVQQATAGSALTVSNTLHLDELFIVGAASSAITLKGANSEYDMVLFANATGSNYWGLRREIGAAGEMGAFRLYNSLTGNNAIYVDTADNVGIGGAQAGANGGKVLALINGTAPTTSPADTVQLFSTDISGGDATLGIRTEKAVVTESVVSDRTLSVKINGTTYKICLKV